LQTASAHPAQKRWQKEKPARWLELSLTSHVSAA
jgi:hypothetical protein